MAVERLAVTPSGLQACRLKVNEWTVRWDQEFDLRT